MRISTTSSGSLVKTTADFDAPDTYHLYFGNEAGQPGTLITFFPMLAGGSARAARHGTGDRRRRSRSPTNRSAAAGTWEGMAAHVGGVATRSGEEALAVRDPDGLAPPRAGCPPGRRPAAAVGGRAGPGRAGDRGPHSVTLTEAGHERTAALLADTLGFRLVEESAARFRFATGDGGAGAL